MKTNNNNNNNLFALLRPQSNNKAQACSAEAPITRTMSLTTTGSSDNYQQISWCRSPAEVGKLLSVLTKQRYRKSGVTPPNATFQNPTSSTGRLFRSYRTPTRSEVR